MQYLFHSASYVWHSVCLFLGWVTYVCHCVCLFVICGNYVGPWVLSVCWLGDLCLVMVGLFATSIAD